MLSAPVSNKVFGYLKDLLNTEDVILTGLISIGVFCLTFIVVSFEFLTGVMAVKGKALKESKTKEWIFKMIFYGIWIFIIWSFQIFSHVAGQSVIVSALKYIMFFSAVLINLWEFKSSGNNLRDRFGKEYKIFKMLDTVISVLENRIGGYLENTICKIKDDGDKPL